MLGIEPTPLALSTNILGMLRDNQLTQLFVSDASAGDENAAKLAGAMRGNTSLKALALDNKRISDQGIGFIADMLAGNRTLQELILNRNPLNDAGGRRLAEGLQHNTGLVRLSLYLDTMRQDAYDAVSRAIIESGNKNFLELNSFAPHFEVKAFAAQNLTALERLADTVRDNPLAANAAELFEARLRQNAFDYKYSNQKFGRDFLRVLNNLPGLPEPSAEVCEALFTATENGYAPLDNPFLWQDAEQARQVLEKMPLNRELLVRRTDKGASLLESLARSVDTGVLVKSLNRQGIHIGGQLLLDAENKPNNVFSALIDRGDVRELFSTENWRGREGVELAAIHQALPARLQDVGYQALRQQITQQHSSLPRGR